MYKVIIVDDESWAIRGISNAFDWEQYGFEISGQFTSAYKAWEAIASQEPDLVVTDIRMPEISGLDLMKRAKAHGIDTEFVIISGYAEFEYAQEALRFGALDYFLKPLDVDMADTFLEKLALHFSRRSAARNHLLLDALTSADEEEIRRYLPAGSNAGCCRVLAFHYEEDRPKPAGLLKLDGLPVRLLEVETGTSTLLAVLMTEQKSELEGITEEWPAGASSPALPVVGISSIGSGLKQISKLIKEADLAASRVFVDEVSGAVHYSPKLHLVKPCIDELQTIVHGNQYDSIETYTLGLQEYFRLHELGMSEVVYLWNQAVGLLISAYPEELRDMELEFLNYAELKERFEDLESLCSFLHDVLTVLRQGNSRALQEGDILSCFNRMVAYIDRNYEQKLYLKELSVQFFINQVYCCQLFKKNLGKTFSEYVAELRIRKARGLLKQTDLSIENIAIQSGYVDYYYFNKVFKKHCGMTPAKFRKREAERSSRP
ncbi:response regulator [Paenibacillus sp. FSL R7-0302]|uniref:response regulator transcription factor n=1 Tax=Paenibacillus sp. FSL R7-0302 TaxID=2921681 RepID=UPI0030F561F1